MELLEIKHRRSLLLDEISDAEERIAIARAKMRTLQRKCNHNNGYTTSSMGETGTYCPDCGYST